VKGGNSETHELSPKHIEGVHDAFIQPEGMILHFLQEGREVRGPQEELMH
jgi:hypothetical protein